MPDREEEEEEEEEDKNADVDPLLEQIGDIGRWQVVTFVILSLFCIPVAWQMLVIVFHAPSDVDYWCKRPEVFANWTSLQWRRYSSPVVVNKNGVKDYDKCHIFARDYSWAPSNVDNLPEAINNITIPCPKLYNVDGRWEFDRSFYKWTILEHFELVCEHEYLQEFINASYMAGVLIGVFFGGMMSDRFGRRPTMLISLTGMLAMSLVVAMADSLMVYVILRFLLALTVVAEYTTIFVFCVEMVGGKWRIITGMLFQLPFSFGFMSMAGLGYLITDWQHLQLTISVPIVIFFLYYWAVPESPRWLLANGKLERATALIESIADINNRQFDPSIQLIPETSAPRHHVSIRGLLNIPEMRYRTINMWFNWFANTFIYYGLLFSYTALGDDIFLNTLIGGAVEIPAYLVSIAICMLLGRKWPIAIMMTIGGMTLMVTVFIPRDVYSHEWPVLLLTTMTRFCITSSFGIVYVYAAEVFPTVVRNSGLSSSSMSGRVGSILSTFVVSLARYYVHLPAIVLGSIAIMAGLLILLMPETKGQKMPDTLEEAKSLGSHFHMRRNTQLHPTATVNSGIVGHDNPQFEADAAAAGTPAMGLAVESDDDVAAESEEPT